MKKTTLLSLVTAAAVVTTSYNKDTVKGTAASRVFFRLRAEAARMREEWPDYHHHGLARP